MNSCCIRCIGNWLVACTRWPLPVTGITCFRNLSQAKESNHGQAPGWSFSLFPLVCVSSGTTAFCSLSHLKKPWDLWLYYKLQMIWKILIWKWCSAFRRLYFPKGLRVLFWQVFGEPAGQPKLRKTWAATDSQTHLSFRPQSLRLVLLRI
jgi:hypothetical protein